MLNMTMMKPEIVKLIGQFSLRYSYGQNLWNHSIGVVTRIPEAIASEMGEDPALAKKHDSPRYRKNPATEVDGVSCSYRSWDIEKIWMDDVVINAAASHHYDVPMTHTISWIVTAADGISASRPEQDSNTKRTALSKRCLSLKNLSTQYNE